MNIGRAQEIAESGAIANVQWNGQKVSIQHVNVEQGTVRIYPLDNPENEQEVPVEKLVEH